MAETNPWKIKAIQEYLANQEKYSGLGKRLLNLGRNIFADIIAEAEFSNRVPTKTIEDLLTGFNAVDAYTNKPFDYVLFSPRMEDTTDKAKGTYDKDEHRGALAKYYFGEDRVFASIFGGMLPQHLLTTTPMDPRHAAILQRSTKLLMNSKDRFDISLAYEPAAREILLLRLRLGSREIYKINRAQRLVIDDFYPSFPSYVEEIEHLKQEFVGLPI